MSTVMTHRGRVAALSRSRTPDDPELVAARRDLRAEGLAAYVRKTIAAAPALNAEQIDEIVTILRGAS